MKKCFLFLLLTVFAGSFAIAESNGKILIAYFSWGGNTKTIAEQIAKATGGTLFEIKALETYPVEYLPTTELAKKAQNENARPALAAHVDTMRQYDIVFLGYPMWWGNMPMACFTFLESYDFSGKTIIPFNTHAGSGAGSSIASIKKECPGAVLKQGISVSNPAYNRARTQTPGINAPRQEVTAWLEKTMADLAKN